MMTERTVAKQAGGVASESGLRNMKLLLESAVCEEGRFNTARVMLGYFLQPVRRL